MLDSVFTFSLINTLMSSLFTNIEILTHEASVQEIDFDMNLLVKKVTKKTITYREATKEIGKI